MIPWLVSLGLPRDRAVIINDRFRAECKKSIKSMHIDDLEVLASELYTKFNFNKT
jgi:hypothetical protein